MLVPSTVSPVEVSSQRGSPTEPNELRRSPQTPPLPPPPPFLANNPREAPRQPPPALKSGQKLEMMSEHLRSKLEGRAPPEAPRSSHSRSPPEAMPPASKPSDVKDIAFESYSNQLQLQQQQHQFSQDNTPSLEDQRQVRRSHRQIMHIYINLVFEAPHL